MNQDAVYLSLLMKVHVDIARTGAEALDQVDKNSYHLIFMDIGLPDISGVAVTKRIRGLEDVGKKNVPIIALTSHVNKRNTCLGVGMQEILNKPINHVDIQSVISKYIQGDQEFSVENSHLPD